jgi:hypothetical protein
MLEKLTFLTFLINEKIYFQHNFKAHLKSFYEEELTLSIYADSTCEEGAAERF